MDQYRGYLQLDEEIRFDRLMKLGEDNLNECRVLETTQVIDPSGRLIQALSRAANALRIERECLLDGAHSRSQASAQARD